MKTKTPCSKVRARQPLGQKDTKEAQEGQTHPPTKTKKGKNGKMTSKVDLGTSDSSQDHTKKEVLPPTEQQEKRPSSRQPKPKCPAIYNEMEKDQLFKKVDPTQKKAQEQAKEKVRLTSTKTSPHNL